MCLRYAKSDNHEHLNSKPVVQTITKMCFLWLFLVLEMGVGIYLGYIKIHNM